MAYRREIFENDKFYHVIFRAFDKKPIFKDDRECLKFLLSGHLINHIPPNIEVKSSRWNNAQILEILNETGIPNNIALREKPLVKISTFSILRNHVHLLLKQISERGIQEFAHRLQTSFGKFFNIKNKIRGPVFEKNFKAVPIEDDRQFRYVVGYITLNVLDTAGIEWRRVALKESWDSVEKVLDSYPWSSYHYFVGRNNFQYLMDGDLVKELFSTPKKLQDHLKNWRFDEIANI